MSDCQKELNKAFKRMAALSGKTLEEARKELAKITEEAKQATISCSAEIQKSFHEALEAGRKSTEDMIQQAKDANKNKAIEKSFQETMIKTEQTFIEVITIAEKQAKKLK